MLFVVRYFAARGAAGPDLDLHNYTCVRDNTRDGCEGTALASTPTIKGTIFIGHLSMSGMNLRVSSVAF
jgi:hypothetical protein